MIATTGQGPGSAYGPTVGDTGLTEAQIAAIADAVLAKISTAIRAGDPVAARAALTPQERRARLGCARVPLPPNTLEALRAAGGAAWDKVEDPPAYLTGERS